MKALLRHECPSCEGIGHLLTEGPDIRKMRKKAGVGLRELARRIHFTPSYLSDIENGRRYLSETILEKYRRHCGGKR